MPIHSTEIEIAGILVDARIAYTYTPGDPGQFSAVPEECREAVGEDWEWTGL